MRTPECADFTMRHLVNRCDVWGAYHPLHRREVLADGSVQKVWTAPARTRRGLVQLDETVLAKHYRGQDVGDVIGLHATSSTNTSRWLAFDLDNHEGTAERANAIRAALPRLTATLRAFQCSPLVEWSDDQGGCHVWVIFHEPVVTPRLYAFATAVVAELELLPCETYPKQAEILAGQFGNWLRLPGRHHTRDHWSSFDIDGEHYEGEDAVEAWLCSLLSNGAHLPELPERQAVVLPFVRRPHAVGSNGSNTDARVRAYIATLPSGLGVGECRNAPGYHLACFCVRDLALSDDEALAWLTEWNSANRTPYSDQKLRSLISDAHRYGRHEFGAAG